MLKRKLLALCLLMALCWVATPSPVRANNAGDRAQWAYFLGMSPEEVLWGSIGAAIGCAFFGPVGGAACAIDFAL
jgi:hypothetical protein